jgi:hypothetical protein
VQKDTDDKVLFRTRKQYLSRPSKQVLALNNYSINYEKKSEFLPLKIMSKNMYRTSSGGKQNSFPKIRFNRSELMKKLNELSISYLKV